MSDTVTFQSGTLATPAANTVIATDDAGASGQVQIVKLSQSADGSATPIAADANGLEVQGAGTAGTPAGGVVSIQGVGSGTAVPVSLSGTVAVTQSGTWDEVGINDSGNSITVDDGGSSLTVDGTVAVSGTVTVDGSGVTQPVSHAALTELAAAIDTEVQVDVVGALPAGTNNIGDVGVLTVPADPFGANADAAATAGSTGSIQAKLRLMTSQLDAIKTAVETIDNTVSGNELQVDIVSGGSSGTQYTEGDTDASITGTALMLEGAANTLVAAPGTPSDGLLVNLGSNNDVTVTGTITANAGTGTLAVSLASVPSHAVTNAGTFAVQVDGSALTALQLIDDPVQVLGTDTYTEATSKGVTIGAVRRDADTTLVNTTNEFGPLQMDANGRLKVEAFSGETLPVSLTSTTVTGTVAVTQSGTWDEVGINDSGNSITVDNGGTFAVQVDGAALTALQLIDDPVATLGTTTYSEATTKGMIVGAVRRDADTTLVDTTNEVGPLQMDANGRLKVEAFSGETLPVSLASVPSHAVTNAGTFAVQVDGNALTALQLIDDTVFTDDAGFTPGTSKVSMAGFEADESSTDSVDEGDAGAARMTLDRKQIITPYPHTAGGLSIFRSLDLDETEEDVKTSAGQIYGIWFANRATSTRYLKIYNLTAANTTVGSSTPVITMPLPGNTTDTISGVFSSTMGIAFDTAICMAATTGIADADTGAPGANDVVVNVFYR